MMKLVRLLILTVIVAAVVYTGCTNRGTNVPTGSIDENWGVLTGTGANHVFPFPGLFYQPRNPNGIQLMSIYVPKEAFLNAEPLPILVLLPPAFGSQDYFFERGLFELAQDMLEKGEIKPMIIACVGNDRVFGGFFYGNSIPGGFYDSILGQNFIDELVNFKGLKIKPGQANHGIGGIGMGAYGAFRAAIKHPGVWGSVTTNDGPLDFDGANGTSGLISLMDDAVNTVPAGPDRFFDRFDSIAADPVTSMFVGGSFAFSPHDTGATLKDSVINVLDTVGGVVVTLPERIILIVRNRTIVTDSVTLVDSMYTSPNFGRLDMHLPFDSTGQPYAPIWNLWMRNNLENMHNAAGHPLLGVNMWIATSTEASYGFHDMTQSWINTLKTQYSSESVTEYDYTGYDGLPATSDQYTYDLLRKMLIWHSNSFYPE